MTRPSQACAMLAMVLLLCGAAWAGSHGHKGSGPDKKGILLVAFGSSYPQAQASFESIEALAKKSFPETPVRWAFTSRIIRSKLAKEGKDLHSPATALARMRDEGFTRVAVQSLHTIPGAEFHDLQSIVKGFQSMSGGFEQLLLGRPLLAAPEDLKRVQQAMLENIPPERKAEEAVIFMGHGTHHPSNAFYPAMAYGLQQKDQNIYLGVVEGSPTLEDLLPELKAKGTQKAYLMPFMSVAGDHVRNDMAGEGPESWKSVLNRAGIETEPVLRGTAEFDNLVAVWIDHLRKTMNEL